MGQNVSRPVTHPTTCDQQPNPPPTQGQNNGQSFYVKDGTGQPRSDLCNRSNELTIFSNKSAAPSNELTVFYVQQQNLKPEDNTHQHGVVLNATLAEASRIIKERAASNAPAASTQNARPQEQGYTLTEKGFAVPANVVSDAIHAILLGGTILGLSVASIATLVGLSIEQIAITALGIFTTAVSSTLLAIPLTLLFVFVGRTLYTLITEPDRSKVWPEIRNNLLLLAKKTLIITLASLSAISIFAISMPLFPLISFIAAGSTLGACALAVGVGSAVGLLLIGCAEGLLVLLKKYGSKPSSAPFVNLVELSPYNATEETASESDTPIHSTTAPLEQEALPEENTDAPPISATASPEKKALPKESIDAASTSSAEAFQGNTNVN